MPDGLASLWLLSLPSLLVATDVDVRLGQPLLRTADIEPTDEAATFRFEFGFSLDRPTVAYLAVVATPQNPLLDDANHWNANVSLREPERGVRSLGPIGAAKALELGTLPAWPGYILKLDLQAAPGALTTPGDRRFSFALAERDAGAMSTWSGGTMDPSLPIEVELRVNEASHLEERRIAETPRQAPQERPGADFVAMVAGGLIMAAAGAWLLQQLIMRQ